MDSIQKKTALIVPCYNEAARLDAKAYCGFVKKNSTVYLIFVNDCSTDATADILETIKALVPERISILHLDKNQGKAGAVRQGFRHAFAGEFNVIGFWDADLATPLEEIASLHRYFDNDEVEIVLGSRVRLLGRHIERKEVRHYLGRIFATAASFVLGLTVYDTQCGAKLFKNTSELQEVFKRPFTVNWIFDVEILARFLAQAQKAKRRSLFGCRVVEHPLMSWRDIPGTKLKLIDFFVAVAELFRIAAFLRRSK